MPSYTSHGSFLYHVTARLLALIYLTLGVFLILSGSVFANNLVPSEAGYLGPNDLSLDYLEDPKSSISIDNILAADFPDSAFQPVKTKIPSFGAQSSVYWFRLRLLNQNEDVTRWWLEVKNPLLDRIDLFSISQSTVESTLCLGDGFPLSLRQVPVRNPVFPIDIPVGGEKIFFIRVATSGALSLPIALWQPERYVAGYSRTNFVLGLYYGAIGALLLYNIFIFAGTLDKNYLFYCLFVGSYAAFQFCMDGLCYQIFFPDGGPINLATNYILASLATIAMLQFSRSFLHIAEHVPLLNGLMKGYMIFAFAFLLWLLPGLGPFAVKTHAYMSMGAALIVVVAVVASVIKGVPESKLFLLAWVFFIVGIVQFDLMLNGVLPYNFVTVHSIQMGSFIEAVLLSLVLAFRVRNLKFENARIEDEAKANLESKVLERTRDLDQAMKELAKSNKVLEQIGLVDGLTGVRNRHYFEEQYPTEWSRCARSNTPISILMIDIDHFKQVNDRFGHIAGDHVLCEVATSIRGVSKRPGDFVSRYGGEEFVVVLPQAPADIAMHLAEQIREKIQQLVISYHHQQISVTVSIGCAAAHQTSSSDTPAQLIEKADAALYQSKRAGRNKVTKSA